MKQSYLDRFDMMLSGYVPGAAAVEAVGNIAKELKTKSQAKPGSFFWVLDPVMGDNGKLYVADDVVPAYRSLVQHADLILPNQFEAECVVAILSSFIEARNSRPSLTTTKSGCSPKSRLPISPRFVPPSKPYIPNTTSRTSSSRPYRCP